MVSLQFDERPKIEGEARSHGGTGSRTEVCLVRRWPCTRWRLICSQFNSKRIGSKRGVGRRAGAVLRRYIEWSCPRNY